MRTDKKTTEDISQLTALQTIAQIYAQIASVRMQQTRKQVLDGRVFIREINETFEDVRRSYAEEVRRLNKGKSGKSEQITFLSHNGKSVAVLLSTNAGLYGAIVPNTYQLFLDELRKHDYEVTIVWQQGLSFYLVDEPDQPYTYFDLPDWGDSSSQLSPIIQHIVQYEEIHVFYGEFHTVITQQPVETLISSHATNSKSSRNPVKYYFEPNMERILIFFETEIFSSLFEQTISESRLAKYASRIIAMDQASENTKNVIKKLKFEALVAQHRFFNRRQLNQLPAIWHLGRER